MKVIHELEYLESLRRLTSEMRPPQTMCKLCMMRFVKVDEQGICKLCRKYGVK